jgi:hypothetical protein
MLAHFSDLGKEVLDFHTGPDFTRTIGAAQVPVERPVLHGAGLETVGIQSYLLRQFSYEPHSPPDRTPCGVAGFLEFSGQTC